MNYYIIYKTDDVGFYETKYTILAIVTDEEIAKDFCNKFQHCHYSKEKIGNKRMTGSQVRF